jgi:hypothetical protein
MHRFLVFLCLLGFLLACSANEERPNRSYRYQCAADQDIVTLLRRPGSESYVKVDAQHENNRILLWNDKIMRTTYFRGTEQSLVSPTFYPDDSAFSVLSQERSLEESHTVDVRSCSCRGWGTVYCPLVVDHCAVIRRYNATQHGPSRLVCVDGTERMQEIAETSFLVAVLWFSVLITCVVCTRPGRHVIHLALSQCIPGYNKCLAARILRTDGERAESMMRRQVNARRLLMLQRMEHVSPDTAAEILSGRIPLSETSHSSNKNSPTSLSLSTCVLSLNAGDAGESDDVFENDCAICFQPLEEGDRVGNLSCQHLFHVECLKTWLKRRNACPLCNKQDVATPQYDGPPHTEATTSVAPSSDNDEAETAEETSASQPTTSNNDSRRVVRTNPARVGGVLLAASLLGSSEAFVGRSHSFGTGPHGRAVRHTRWERDPDIAHKTASLNPFSNAFGQARSIISDENLSDPITAYFRRTTETKEGAFTPTGSEKTWLGRFQGYANNMEAQLDEISGWILAYSDLRPDSERSVAGRAFLATNIAYVVAGILLAQNGDPLFGFLTEMTSIASYAYHYGQLESRGVSNLPTVRLALLIDYILAFTSIGVALFYLFSTGGEAALTVLPPSILALGTLGASWVFETGRRYMILHGLWHFFSAYTGYLVGILHGASL